MVMTTKAIIDDEKDSINYYARSIGIWQELIRKTEEDYYKQMYEYFRNVDIIELENANERLQTLRRKLADYERRQPKLS